MNPLIALPTYDGSSNVKSTMAAATARERMKSVKIMSLSSSALTCNFNMLWCEALNNKTISHFVMLHADIIPGEDNWLSHLGRIADATGADVLSVVSPIKRETGQTSTALARGDEYGHHRRLTMREVMTLPESFTRKEVARLFGWDWKESTLLVNTGLMCVSMKKRDVMPKMTFGVGNWIRQDAQGKYYTVFCPEDWAWSMQAQALGLSVWATRAVPLAHMNGHMAYKNNTAWGTLEHDDTDQGDQNATKVEASQ